jgi:Bifunctional DNA primase/polymerase, N-terminal
VFLLTFSPVPGVLAPPHHGKDASGFAAWNRARREGLVEQPLAVVATPSGGMHAYFRGSEQRSASTSAHVDFRSQGGYVVAPHSTVGGKPYVVVKRDPQSTASVDFGAVRQLVEPQRERTPWNPPQQVRDGGRQNLDHLVQHMAGLDDGRKRYLFWAANRILDHGQPERLADLAAAARAAGSDPRQIERTIESARQQQRQDPHAAVPQPRESVRVSVPRGGRRQNPEPEGPRQRDGQADRDAGQQPERRGRVVVLEADRDGAEAPGQPEPGQEPVSRTEHSAARPAGQEAERDRERVTGAEPEAASVPGREEPARPFAQPEPEPEREAGD